MPSPVGSSILKALAYFLLASASQLAAQSPSDYIVRAEATVQTNPPEVHLQWIADPNATTYNIYRKQKGSLNWGGLIGTLPGTATTFTDTNVLVGEAWEYRLSKTANGYTGIGFVYAGIESAAQSDYGRIILVLDTSVTRSLQPEVDRLQRDLWGDGWQVSVLEVDRSTAVTDVHAGIEAVWNSDPARTRTVLLLGHVPVPYSGNLNPDGHPEHQGAWPADVYYGELNGAWTDATVNTTNAARPENQNTIGDGKWDQTNLPSDVELEVGRIDFNNMPAFAATEADLLRQYLDRDHAWRHKRFSMPDSALVDDNFGVFGGENFAGNGWRNPSPLVGPNHVAADDFRTALNNADHLWAYGCGGGWYEGASGVGSTQDFATDSLRAVFTMLFGSYHGDWDSQNNFLRAALAAKGTILTCAWAGRPHWYFHYMGLGEPIGFSARLTQNNFSTYPTNYGGRFVHIALMGDPSLRMHVTAPPSGLEVTALGGGSRHLLTWHPSTEAILQYHVFAQDSLGGPYIELGTTQDTTLELTCRDVGTHRYLVRAEALVIGHSGSYYNLSQGAFDTISTSFDQTPLISLPSPNAYCIGDSIQIPYTTTAELCPGNLFLAEISDSAGNFSSSTVIGSLADITSGTIPCLLPPGLDWGSHYRIRVSSTLPSLTGPDNGGDLTIQGLPTAIGTVQQGPAPNQFTGTSTSTGATQCLWRWGTTDSTYGCGPQTYTATVPYFTVYLIAQNACGSDTAFLGDFVIASPDPRDQNPIQLSPNPAGDQFTITADGNLHMISEVRIWNMFGQKVLDIQWNGSRPLAFATEGWSRGIYLVEAIGKGSTWRRRLVLE